MQQTVKQKSLPLNKDKWARITETAEAYARQKNSFLVEYGHVKYLHYLGKKRKLRDELVAAGFTSPFGLQARQWKLVLDDALFTLERQWEAAIVGVKERLYRHEGLSDEEKHYAFWLLYRDEKRGRDWKRLQAIFTHEDVVNQKISLDSEGRAKVRNYLKRAFRRILGTRPRVKKARSFVVDQQMYRVFNRGKRQYIAVATLTPGERAVIPLTGIHAMRGNLRVVLFPDEQAVEIHLSREPHTYSPGEGEAGIDLGVTEVFTDDTGRKYRPEYGEALQEMSDHILDNSRKRGKLWALRRKLLEQDPPKARRILKHNLGLIKQTRRNKRYRARCENEINRAFNELYKKRRPQIIAYEDLAHLRGKAKSKGLSRKVSGWQRNIIKERREYKNYVYSVTDPGPQNAAYSSQECPQCGWVDAKNRNGDIFKCRQCGFTADADQVAAMNLKKRLHDEEITRYTPYKTVKEILLQRYNQKAN
ncbi:Putative transposase DNA-binding domain-containing protein [Carboxydocella sporoproducens DSM 16521]|uniref:Transposase DNA-binding domain-containing protein n=2 Tax=Carboxydocella TaxID=178898 RepID=A0A2R4N2I6_CARTR|nr:MULTISPECIES: zinc ribbon domain-containing protein [Carboxydocella]AVX21326.1 Putative transposase DNA-binding domain-containing protein [Carboxydocella thermautotrophica]AVX31757.1 Putative transposase DNA-binding domain-containing protein [Carboxydocella thermautotrophica]SJZ66108.1 Putative transposase DNA-binding domain-containing protein [Carboxydocella sporoproducens DSM 16521]